MVLNSANQMFDLTQESDEWDFGTAADVDLDRGSFVKALGGDDVIYGGQWSDRIFGGDGDDHLYGLAGEDRIDGGRGADYICGGGDNDRIDGGRGADVLGGGSGDDRLYGAIGDDAISGGSGNDTLAGGRGDDLLRGGDGNDTFVFDSLCEGVDDIVDIEASTPAGEGPQVIADVIDLSEIFEGADCEAIAANIDDYVKIDEGGLWVDADGLELTIDTNEDSIADASAEGAYIATGSFLADSSYAVSICEEDTVLVQYLVVV